MKLNAACSYTPNCWNSEESFKGSFAISSFSPLTPSHIHHSQWASQGLQSGATGYSSTYQDPLTLLPGVCRVVALVQGKANVAWILQFPVGELDCKITAQD